MRAKWIRALSIVVLLVVAAQAEDIGEPAHRQKDHHRGEQADARDPPEEHVVRTKFFAQNWQGYVQGREDRSHEKEVKADYKQDDPAVDGWLVRRDGASGHRLE